MGMTSTTHTIIYLIILTAVLIIKGVSCVTDKFKQYVLILIKIIIFCFKVSVRASLSPLQQAA